jgi:hypothetical protein
MKLSQINEECKYYLNILTAQVSSPFAINVLEHKKAIRDILDNFEGHLHKCYNSNGMYDHASLKYHATYMSEAAIIIKSKLTKGEFISITHREHAKPLAILIEEMQGLSGQKLLTYLYENLKSVTILKEEAKLIDVKYKTTMPNSFILFSRFEEFGIKLVKNN